MQYFAQDEATRLDPDADRLRDAGRRTRRSTWCRRIRNILGGFLFSGDDVYKKVRVLSGGERTRLAVARMLLRPSNTLLLDEPTNHLDLDSKDVLLDALDDYGGTLIFVSHDRYFVDRLATKIIEVGSGDAVVYPGTYEEFLWSKKQRAAGAAPPAAGGRQAASAARRGASRLDRSAQAREPTPQRRQAQPTPEAPAAVTYDDKKRRDAEARKARKARKARAARGSTSSRRASPNASRRSRSSRRRWRRPGSTTTTTAAKPVIDRHQALMWEVGDLMGQWEDAAAEH